jgi:hypothetical protein
MARKRSYFPSGRRPPQFQARLPSLVRSVAIQDAIYHTADNGNTIARASIVTRAVVVVVVGATVIDRSIVGRSIAVASAGTGNMTDTSPASDCTSARRMSTCRRVSGVGATSRMAGSERIRRPWRATERGRDRESQECFMNQVSLLLNLKRKILS